MKKHVSETARIVESVNFESALIKLNYSYKHRLMFWERKTVSHPLISSCWSGQAGQNGEDFADEIIK